MHVRVCAIDNIILAGPMLMKVGACRTLIVANVFVTAGVILQVRSVLGSWGVGCRAAPFPTSPYSVPRPAWFHHKILVLIS